MRTIPGYAVINNDGRILAYPSKTEYFVAAQTADSATRWLSSDKAASKHTDYVRILGVFAEAEFQIALQTYDMARWFVAEMEL